MESAPLFRLAARGVDYIPGNGAGYSQIVVSYPDADTESYLKEGKDYYIGSDGKAHYFSGPPSRGTTESGIAAMSGKTPVYRSINPDYYPEENSEYNYTDLTPGDDGTDNPYGIDVDAFLHWAYSQLGYTEKASNADLNSKTDNAGDKNYTKYGEWYGDLSDNPDFDSAYWCAMFAAWCADKAGITSDKIKYTASTSDYINWYKGQGRFQSKESGYIPKAGDLILYQWYTKAEEGKGCYIKNADGSYKYVGKNKGNYNLNGHTGIVVGYADGYVYTIEGNRGNKVYFNSRPLDYVNLKGFGVNGGQSLGVIPPEFATGGSTF